MQCSALSQWPGKRSRSEWSPGCCVSMTCPLIDVNLAMGHSAVGIPLVFVWQSILNPDMWNAKAGVSGKIGKGLVKLAATFGHYKQYECSPHIFHISGSHLSKVSLGIRSICLRFLVTVNMVCDLSFIFYNPQQTANFNIICWKPLPRNCWEQGERTATTWQVLSRLSRHWAYGGEQNRPSLCPCVGDKYPVPC